MAHVFQIRIASKRQVTMPQQLLDLLRLREGDFLEIITDRNQVVAVRPLKVVPTNLFTPEILKKLDRRAEQIDRGEYREFSDITTFPKKPSQKVAAKAATAGGKPI
ncbi:MAG: hypothetical protein WAM91_16945 [Candidatus Acidiferrales bacterium]